jgi:RNA polymerase sigma-70 factor (ECF subfamily)
MEAALTTGGEEARPRAGDDLSAIVARACLGEERAWEELVRLYARRVYALAQSRLRRPDLAEEVTQSVFVTIATKLKDQEYHEQGRFEAWLFRVTMNRIRDAARSNKRRAVSIEPGLMEAMPAADGASVGAAEAADWIAPLRAALTTLNDADREVIELRHHGRLGFQAIAELLGQPVGTVLARHHRALRKLRAVMEPDQETLSGPEPGHEPAEERP